ncbi:TraR/DksA family transcriptional regulator [Halomonas stenophila]|uniref:DnaK suppressor protein n=1 Tax=Halomonas stenophila TaxID=795312 RepID=A0A7W5EWN9_9GAMM|nr:TraR/DksA family transcriptional regulator [Halomonas stenophila]MBB3232372.1 DnaK suppressor protein [Halomonas stenophila]
MNHLDLNMATVSARLEAMRDDLLQQSADSRDARETVMLDQSSVGRLSRMDALQGQAMAKAEEERRRLTLTRIASALARIERGEYGVCIACGEWIAVRRLEGDPVVLKCIDCAE